MTAPGRRWPRIIGHRGAALAAPENTLAGFCMAAALNVEWVEFDVRLTSDDRCILLHDDTRDWRRPVGALASAMLHADQRRLAQPTVEVVRDAGLPLFAYTVNLPQRARELFSWGVDSVFSDCPDRVAGGLAGEAI